MKKYTFISMLFLIGLSSNVSALKITGKWQQGSLLFGNVAPSSEVFYKDKKITVSDYGVFIIGLHRDEPKTVKIKVVSPPQTNKKQTNKKQTDKKQTKIHTFAVAPREYQLQAIDGIKKDFVWPSEQQKQRAIAETKAIKKAKAIVSYRQDFLNKFIRPVAGITTGVYGSQRSYNGVPSRPHYGWDIAAKTGTPVKSPNSGVVVFAQLDTFFSGGLVIIDHGFNLTSSFLHLSAINVKVGDEIKIGQKIAEVGATGRVTGAHLDWRMDWRGNRIDPQPLCDCQ